MHRIIFMAGSIIASSLGLALAGLVLREAIRNSRSQTRSKPFHDRVFTDPASVFRSRIWDIAVRGYDTPELQHDDNLARQRQSGNDRSVQ
jgi:hypothetical protein